MIKKLTIYYLIMFIAFVLGVVLLVIASKIKNKENVKSIMEITGGVLITLSSLAFVGIQLEEREKRRIFFAGLGGRGISGRFAPVITNFRSNNLKF